jgi:hypothetical protein
VTIVAKAGLDRKAGILWDVWHVCDNGRRWLACFKMLEVAREVYPDLVTKHEA